MKIASSRWTWLVIMNVVAWGLLGFYQHSLAQQPRGPVLPFANSVEQRGDIVKEAREIKDLLKETNAMLRELVSREATNAKPQR